MEVSKGQWQGHPRRVERPLPLSFFLETDFICFLNLNPGRFFTLLADRVYVMTLGVFFWILETDPLWQCSTRTHLHHLL
jgi:hypothetical protein